VTRSSDPEKRDSQQLSQRLHILSAADDVLWKYGPSRATVAAVADAARLSKGMVYLHFATKTDLWAAVLQRRIDYICERLVLAADISPGAAQLRVMLRALVHEVVDRHREFSLSREWFGRADESTEPSVPMDRCGESIEKMIEIVTSAIRRGQDDGSIAPVKSPRRTALLFIESLASTMHLRLREESVPTAASTTMSARAAATSLTELLCLGIEARN
jgi:AcrR family transcriptional regulator